MNIDQENKPKRTKAKRKAVSNSGMRSCVISLSKAWHQQIAQQETVAIEFYNRVLYLLRNNLFYHDYLVGREVKFDSDTPKFDHKYPNFESVYEQIKAYEQYAILPSQVAQNIAKLVIESFKSYRGLILAKKKGVLAKDAKINLPRYKKIKNEAIDQFLKAKIISVEMTYDRGNFTKKGQEVSLTPMTIDGKKLKTKITFRLPTYLETVTINTITVIKNGTGYVANIAYRKEGFSADIPEALPPIGYQLLAIDLGLNNLATSVNTVNGESMIIDGKYLKSVNQYYNKTVAELRSNMDLTKQQAEKDKYFKRIQKATVRRNRTVRDFMHKIAKRITREAQALGVTDVVVGYNKEWKQDINLGKQTNQKFVQIPYRKLIDALRDKLQEVGIHLRETEESYTSKIDHLAGELMQHHESYLGKRKKRGLFQSSTNRLINADVNGAIGIIQKTQKSNDHSVLERIVSSGRFFRPVRIYPGVAKHVALKKTASCRKAA